MSDQPNIRPADAVIPLASAGRLSWMMRGLIAALFAAAVAVVLVTNGWLTGRGIVRYNPDTIIGSERIVAFGDGRLVFAPVEDLGFGFGMVLLTCIAWTWLGRGHGETA